MSIRTGSPKTPIYLKFVLTSWLAACAFVAAILVLRKLLPFDQPSDFLLLRWITDWLASAFRLPLDLFVLCLLAVPVSFYTALFLLLGYLSRFIRTAKASQKSL